MRHKWRRYTSLEYPNTSQIAPKPLMHELDRFSKAAVFDDSATSFDGALGQSVSNLDSTSKVM